jgi:16S rRNA processing protein RimM
MEVYSDAPERLMDLRRVYFNDDPAPQRVTRIRMHGRQALLTFPDVTDRDSAEAMRGTVIRISGSQARPLEEGAFYHYQIIGLSAFLESGEPLGTVSDIIEAGEVDVYVVRDPQGREHLFPALRDVVLDIDPMEGRVIVRPQVWEDE